MKALCANIERISPCVSSDRPPLLPHRCRIFASARRIALPSPSAFPPAPSPDHRGDAASIVHKWFLPNVSTLLLLRFLRRDHFTQIGDDTLLLPQFRFLLRNLLLQLIRLTILHTLHPDLLQSLRKRLFQRPLPCRVLLLLPLEHLPHTPLHHQPHHASAAAAASVDGARCSQRCTVPPSSSVPTRPPAPATPSEPNRRLEPNRRSEPNPSGVSSAAVLRWFPDIKSTFFQSPILRFRRFPLFLQQLLLHRHLRVM